MSNEKAKLTPGKIAYKYFPETSFDDCMMNCMSCDEDQCDRQDNAIKALSKDIKACADQETASLKERVEKLEKQLKKLSESTVIAEAEASDLEQEIEKIKEAIGCVIQHGYKFIQDPNYESIAWIVTSYGQKRGQFSNIPTHGFKHIK